MNQVVPFQPTHFSFGEFIPPTHKINVIWTEGSACELTIYFSETQSIIKSQKTDATFGEISKIVASMWDGLGENEKTVSFNLKMTYRSELVEWSEIRSILIA